MLDNLKCDADPLRHMRLVRLHGRHPIDRETLMASEQWKQAVYSVANYAPDTDRQLDLA